MRAVQIHAIGEDLKVIDTDPPRQWEGQRIVNIRSAALNRRDYWIQQGLYPKPKLPGILGSDGAGTSDGEDVVINPGLAWGPDDRVQSRQFHILGMPQAGTFAEKVAVPEENVYPKPEHLSWDEAAALPLAGVTAYRALAIQGKAEANQKVLITGIGGGVALMAMQFAIALGLEAFVTSSSDEKLQRARDLGAKGCANYTRDNWVEEITAAAGGFDLVLDSAGGEAIGSLLRSVNPAGRMVIYGGTLGPIESLSPQILFWRQITVKGSTMGSPDDFEGMLRLVNKHEITPVVDSVFALDKVNDAMARLRDTLQFGKIVLRISK